MRLSSTLALFLTVQTASGSRKNLRPRRMQDGDATAGTALDLTFADSEAYTDSSTLNDFITDLDVEIEELTKKIDEIDTEFGFDTPDETTNVETTDTCDLTALGVERDALACNPDEFAFADEEDCKAKCEDCIHDCADPKEAVWDPTVSTCYYTCECEKPNCEKKGMVIDTENTETCTYTCKCPNDCVDPGFVHDDDCNCYDPNNTSEVTTTVTTVTCDLAVLQAAIDDVAATCDSDEFAVADEEDCKAKCEDCPESCDGPKTEEVWGAPNTCALTCECKEPNCGNGKVLVGEQHPDTCFYTCECDPAALEAAKEALLAAGSCDVEADEFIVTENCEVKCDGCPDEPACGVSQKVVREDPTNCSYICEACTPCADPSHVHDEDCVCYDPNETTENIEKTDNPNKPEKTKPEKPDKGGKPDGKSF